MGYNYDKKSELSTKQFVIGLNHHIANQIPLQHYDIVIDVKGTDKAIIDNLIKKQLTPSGLEVVTKAFNKIEFDN